ncbi:carotenoid cleavage dioxygenase 7, chloroplastic [Cannabis sativa]|uniref:carotenoid cleavage dioxygenase 7, chloroplastic n=1 Tax=Cannabis sativa TaxID=3483 RepID=UPI0029CA86FB|nr:carotenoid cleavage dioxygenase 7, chloroplastic [Cannabis sativa]
MLSNLCLEIIPPKHPSPLQSPAVHRVHLSPLTKARPQQPPPPTAALSISTSVNDNRVTTTSNIPIITSQNDAVEDSTAAFWDYQFLFVSQRSETAKPVTLRVVDGAVPTDFPIGTYYLTGPGIFSDDHGSTVHPLDGHGYLRAFVFDSSQEVKFMARYVKTEAQTEEHDSETDTWRFAYRGPFSVLKGGQKLGNTKVMKNVANTSVLMWGGRLLCLWEGGDPYEIESRTLNTIGKLDLINGCDSVSDAVYNNNNNNNNKVDDDDDDAWGLAARLLKPILYGVFKMPPKRLLSHYKLDIQRNRLLTVSCNAEDMLLPRSNFTFYEFDSNFKLLHKKEFHISEHLMIHDWAFTDSYYIIFANRIKLNVLGAITAVSGVSPMIEALSVNPDKTKTPIYLLPRFPEENKIKRDWRVPLEANSQLWLLHVGNAYQTLEDNGNKINIQIHASACSYQWFNFRKLFGYDWHNGKLDPSIMNLNHGKNDTLPHLLQVSITVDAENCNCEVETLNKWSKSSDFPAINSAFSGTKNTYVYAASSSGSRPTLPHFPFDTVAKLNVVNKFVHTWSVGNRRFIGEPTFVPKGTEEDDGYLLVVEYAVSIQKCFLVILNAKRIGQTDALVARLEVPKHLNFPLGFHGLWANSN